MKIETGHYTVNGTIFNSKILAILEAQKTQSNIQWHYFDKELKSVNWLVEPEIQLDTFYRMRAMQIRNAYDYVIVFCSGGADSTNVIKSFLNNKIHVDEVVAMAPMSGLNNWSWDTSDKSAANTITETKISLFPLLTEIENLSPTTKISISDYFIDFQNFKTDEWLYEMSTGGFIGPTAAVFGRLDKFSHIEKLAEQGKKIAVVFGIDKPVIRFSMFGIHYVITDEVVNVPKQPFRTPYPNVDRVMFYYTPDLPEMMVKQAHVVCKALFQPENQLLLKMVKDLSKPAIHTYKSSSKLLDQILLNSKERHKIDRIPVPQPNTIYQRGIVPFIYPNTHVKDLWQCNKVDIKRGFFPQDVGWFHELHNDTKMAEMLASDFSLLYNKINPAYMNAEKTGLGLYSKLHTVGTLDDFTITSDQ
jgi:hypothetical protein